MFLGYYKDEKKTAEALDKDGFLHTGDVGEILPNGALKIIDRAKNIFKLAQGEYIAPEKIEQIFAKVPGVESNFVTGDSLQAYCVVVCTPNKDKLLEIAKSLNISKLAPSIILEIKMLGIRIIPPQYECGHRKSYTLFMVDSARHGLPVYRQRYLSPSLERVCPNLITADDPLDALYKNKEIRKSLLKTLTQHGRDAKLFGFELPKNIYLEPKTLAELGLV